MTISDLLIRENDEDEVIGISFGNNYMFMSADLSEIITGIVVGRGTQRRPCLPLQTKNQDLDGTRTD